METTTADAEFTLRIARNTTGAVHAAREVTEEIVKYEGEIGSLVAVGTGEFETSIVKACGADSNTWRTQYAGTQKALDPQAAITCKKCLRALGH